jgi:hypothetical protein
MKLLARYCSFALALQVDFGSEQPESLSSILKDPLSTPALAQAALPSFAQLDRVHFSLLRRRFGYSRHTLDTPTALRDQLRVITFP